MIITPSQNYHFFFVVRTFKIKFRVLFLNLFLVLKVKQYLLLSVMSLNLNYSLS